MTDHDRIHQLETKIADLKARLPRHSVPPALIIALEELEQELRILLGGEGRAGPPDLSRGQE